VWICCFLPHGLITMHLVHEIYIMGEKKRHKARIRSKFNVKILNRKLTEHAEAEHHIIGTEGAEIPHPHLCVIFDDFEGTFPSIFQVSQKKKKVF
jgi:hypothetical protein